MRISDWSSDVCSSDLHRGGIARNGIASDLAVVLRTLWFRGQARHELGSAILGGQRQPGQGRGKDVPGRRCSLYGIDRTSVVSGKSGSVRVDLGGRRIIHKKNNKNTKIHNKQGQ